MKLKELYEQYKQNKTKVFLNGLPEEDGGIITELQEDYLVFKIEKKSEKLDGATVEEVIFPIDKIDIIGLVPVKSALAKIETVIETPAK